MHRSARHRLILVALGAVMTAWLSTPAVAAAAPAIADSYPEVNFDSATPLFFGSSTQAGQSFTAVDGTLDSAKFFLRRTGSPTGNAYAVLYAITGTYGTNSVPTGPPLAVSSPVVAGTLPAVFGLVTFAFDNTVTLNSGTKYVIAVKYDDAGSSGSNSVAVAEDSSPAHPGNGSVYFTSMGWLVSTYDRIFYVYETPPAPLRVVSTVPAASAWSLALLAALGIGVLSVNASRRTAA